MTTRRAVLGGLLAAFALVVVTLAYNNVPSTVTETDKAAVRRVMAGKNVPSAPETWEQQLALVFEAQDAILTVAGVNEGLPLGKSREINDLIKAGHGLCYDRSRAIETILRSYGMETRHVAVYSTAETGAWWKSLLTPKVASHAVTEVKTQKGWLVIDSNLRWVALTASGEPMDMDAVRDNPDQDWSSRNADDMNQVFKEPFTWVYGLYSRHGKFYPPYSPVPDINWSEFLYEITGDAT